MKVFHLVEDYSFESGGIRTVIKDLEKFVPVNHQIITSKCDIDDKNVKVFNSNLPWNYNKEYKNYLDTTLNEKNSVYHIHGVWMYQQYIGSQLALKGRKPFLITPHGMFEPWLWKQGYVKKKLYFEFFTKKPFSKAKVIHAITEQERENLYKILPNNSRIEVIPNLIETKNLLKIDLENFEKEEKFILFLGRIHPKKGIDLLINAFNRLKDKDIKLKIAGPENSYTKELKKLANSLGISSRVEFLGKIIGKEKFLLYKNAHVFVAPSHSEVIGMVNLEAAIMSTPVITTWQTGLYTEWNNEGGILINPNINELENALEKSISWSLQERIDRGEKLKNFVINNYSWEKNVYKWNNLYNDLVD